MKDNPLMQKLLASYQFSGWYRSRTGKDVKASPDGIKAEIGFLNGKLIKLTTQKEKL